MNSATWVVLWVALFLSWVLIPLIVIQYRLDVAPKRYEEIRNRFVRRPLEAPSRAGQSRRSAALHYARLLYPDAEDKDSERLLKEQFWYFHAWNRYALPLILVTLTSIGATRIIAGIRQDGAGAGGQSLEMISGLPFQRSHASFPPRPWPRLATEDAIMANTLDRRLV